VNDQETSRYYSYQGALEWFIHKGPRPFPSKDYTLIGIYSTLEEAAQAIVLSQKHKGTQKPDGKPAASGSDKDEYHGPLGDVVREGLRFSASFEGVPVGKYGTFDAAIAALLKKRGGIF
jgi:hypothetical protein